MSKHFTNHSLIKNPEHPLFYFYSSKSKLPKGILIIPFNQQLVTELKDNKNDRLELQSSPFMHLIERHCDSKDLTDETERLAIENLLTNFLVNYSKVQSARIYRTQINGQKLDKSILSNLNFNPKLIQDIYSDKPLDQIKNILNLHNLINS